jgi:hypothetical protein
MNPFEYVNAINFTKQNLIVDDLTEKAYNGFMVNRSLSYLNHHIDKKLQHDFLINIIRKRKRFSKWEKKKADGDVDVIKEYYGYNDLKARQVLGLLSPEQLEQLYKKVNKGGRK